MSAPPHALTAALAAALLWLGGLPRPALAQQAPTPLTLDAALHHAAGTSPFFAQSRLRTAAAEAQSDAQCARLYPVLLATGQAVRNDSEVAFGDTVVVNLVDTSARIVLSADLFAAGNIPRCQASRRDVESTDQARREDERGRLFEIAQAYVAVLAAERQVTIAEQALELRQVQLEAAQARREAEMALASDVSRAALEVTRSEQELVSRRADQTDAMDSLAFLLGDEAGTTYALETPAEMEGGAGLAERPGDRAAQLAEAAAERRLAAPYWDLIPTVGLQFVSNFQRDSFTDPDGFNWALTFVLTWTIFDGGVRYAEMDAARAERENASLQREELARSQRFDVARAQRRQDTATASLDLARQTERLAGQTYTDVQAMLEQGLSTGLEQSDALNDWIAAQLGLTIAELEVRLAELERAYASGALWPEGAASVR